MLPYLSWVMLNRKGSSLFVDLRPDRWKHTVSWSPIALKACKSLHTQWQTSGGGSSPSRRQDDDVTDLMGAAAGQGAAAGRALGLPLFSPAQLLVVLGVDAAAPSVATATAPVPIVKVHPHEEIYLCVDLFTTGTKVTTCNPCEHILFQPHERGKKYRGRRS
jgi:hypothetical protein